MPKVSIVIPIYKVEKFLRQCLDSVINQTLEDIEIILVDDGSPDSCPQICDEYAAKDSRIKVIHKENGGYGTACNRGIEEATGDYIGLVESDDWIEPDMYEKLYNQITKFDADVCITSFYEYMEDSLFKDGTHNRKFMETINNTTNNNLFSIMDFPFLYTVHESVWAKLYKKEFIKNIKFSEQKGASYQDGPFMTEIFCKTDKIIAVHDFLYHYRIDNINSSASNKRKDARLMTILDQRELAKNILIKYNKYNDLKEEFYYQSLKAPFRFYRNISSKYKKEFYEKWKSFIKDLTIEDCSKFKLLPKNKIQFLKALIEDNYRASQFDEYSSFDILGYPIIERTTKNNNTKKRFLGIPYCTRRHINGYLYKEFLGKAYRIKQDQYYEKHYIFGIQVLCKKNRKKYDDINNFLYFNEIAQNIHPIIFKNSKNKNLGRDVILFACGPSARYYEIIDNAVHVSINRAMLNTNIRFDTLFMHDEEFVIENLHTLKNYDAEKYCAYHINKKNAKNFNTSTKDLLYIGAKRLLISDPQYKGADENIPDIINPDISKGLLYDRGGGTVFSALQYILYTHPKRIYLVGCDCTDSGYFYDRQRKNILLSKTEHLWHEAAYAIKILYPDIEVISINPVGLKGLFHDVYTTDYLNEHPEIKNVEIIKGSTEKEVVNV